MEQVDKGKPMKSLKVIESTIQWLKQDYESSIFEDRSGEMKVCRGKVYKYLEMTFEFPNPVSDQDFDD